MPPTLGEMCFPLQSLGLRVRQIEESRHRIPNDLHGGGSNGKLICLRNPVGLISLISFDILR